MQNKELLDLLEQIKYIHTKKSHDYSSSGPDENFYRCAEISKWFTSDLDKVFAQFVAVKLARIAVLLDNKNPSNESIEDSFLDLTTYCALWAANYKRREHYRQGNADTTIE